MFTDYTVSGEVKDGRLEMSADVRADLTKAMRHFKPGPVTIRVERETSGKRSNQANRYYRLVLGLIADHTGDDEDDLHEYFKRRFLEPETIKVMGHEIEIYTSIKDPKKFHKYVEDIRRFALVELSVETPDPDPALRGQSRHAKRRAA